MICNGFGQEGKPSFQRLWTDADNAAGITRSFPLLTAPDELDEVDDVGDLEDQDDKGPDFTALTSDHVSVVIQAKDNVWDRRKISRKKRTTEELRKDEDLMKRLRKMFSLVHWEQV